jgi:hypothetical protein
VLARVFADFPKVMGREVAAFIGPDDTQPDRPGGIMWEPVRQDFGPPVRTTGGPGDDGPCATALWEVLVSIWGETFEHAQVLTDLFIGAGHRLLSAHSFKAVRAEWNAGAVGSKGAVCRLTVQISAPVLKVPVPARPIDTLNVTHTMGNDSVVTPQTLES